MNNITVTQIHDLKFKWWNKILSIFVNFKLKLSKIVRIELTLFKSSIHIKELPLLYCIEAILSVTWWIYFGNSSVTYSALLLYCVSFQWTFFIIKWTFFSLHFILLNFVCFSVCVKLTNSYKLTNNKLTNNKFIYWNFCTVKVLLIWIENDKVFTVEISTYSI